VKAGSIVEQDLRSPGVYKMGLRVNGGTGPRLEEYMRNGRLGEKMGEIQPNRTRTSDSNVNVTFHWYRRGGTRRGFEVKSEN